MRIPRSSTRARVALQTLIAACALCAVAAPQALAVTALPPAGYTSFYPDRPLAGKPVHFNAYIDDSEDCTTVCQPAFDADLSQYYQWDFNNDGVYNGTGDDIGEADGGSYQYPIHTFPSAGTQIVHLKIKDADDGLYTTIVTTVQVHDANWAPTGDFQLYGSNVGCGYYNSYGCGNMTVRSGRAADFSAYGEDPDNGDYYGSGIPADASHYEWDFNGDGTYGGAGDDYTGSPDAPSHTWAASNTTTQYLVRLRMTDADGAQSVVAHSVEVRPSTDNIAPYASFETDPYYPSSASQEVSFYLSTWDSDGQVAQDSDHIQWDFNDDGTFGDPVAGSGAGTLTNPLHTFGTAGDKTVSVKVIDDEGRATVETRTIRVARPVSAPYVDIYSTPYEPRVDVSTEFDSGIYTPGATYAWDLNGDGAFDDSTAQFPTRTYTTEGDVTVRVRVTVPGVAPVADRTSESARTMHVSAGNASPDAEFTMQNWSGYGGYYGYYGNLYRGLAGKNLGFSGSAYDYDGSVNLSSGLSWDWDGNQSFGDALGAGGTAADPFHSFTGASNGLVLMRATDDAGGTSIVGHSVDIHTVNEAPHVTMDPSAAYDGWYGTGDTVPFHAYADDDSSVASYAWDLDNDGSFDDASTQDTQFVFANPGVNTVRVKVTDDDGASTIDTETVNIRFGSAVQPSNNTPPTISGTATVGQTLTGSPGTWYGTNTLGYPMSFAYQWQRCDSNGLNCTDIAGATSSQYTLLNGDAGSEIRVGVRASNNAGTSDWSYSAPTAVVSTGPPVYQGGAGTTGGSNPPKDGETLTAVNGTWTGTPTFSYQWERCDSNGLNCSNITLATGSTYRLVTADIGSRIMVVITGTNGAGSDTATVGPAAAVVAAVPSNTGLPGITGTKTDGQVLTASPGTWTGSPSSYAYQWRRCNSAGTSCADIPLATADTYTLTPSDVGSTIRVVVTAHNATGDSAPATSPATTVVQAVPAAVDTSPSVAGTPTDGQTLTGTDGTFTGTPTITVSRQWRRCDSAGLNCIDIAGATNGTYLLTTADIGKTIRFRNTGSNATLAGGGSATSDSTATGIVQAIPAHYGSGAGLTGGSTPPKDGETLTAVKGTWTGSTPIAYSYQWQRCDADGTSNCADIGSATGSAYTLVTGDVGHTVRAVIDGTNAALTGGGADTTTTAASGVVVAAVPSNQALPSIGGTTTDGQTLTAAHGTWSGTPSSYTYQWRRCDSTGGSCANVGGATTTYDLSPADVGSTMRVVVTAHNATGDSSPATSPATSVVQAIPAAAGAAPTVAGTPADGQTLTGTDGTFTGTPTITVTRQWLRCDATGGGCSEIGGATGATYGLTAADVGSTIRLRNVGSNASLPGGTGATSDSAATAVVQAIAPSAGTAPTVSGTTTQGQTLTGANGTWAGTAPIAFGSQWRRCDATGGACTDIAGATAATRVLAAEDVGRTLRYRVIASNAGGSASADSAPTAVVAALPSTPGAGEEASEASSNAGGVSRFVKGLHLGQILKQPSFLAGVTVKPETKVKIDLLLSKILAHRSSAHAVAARVVVIASGSKFFASGGKGKVRVRTTAAGRRALKKATRAKLIVRVTITHAGRKGVSQRSVTLKR